MPLIRRCSVRWYSSSSLRYYVVSVSFGSVHDMEHESYSVQALNICHMLLCHQLKLTRKLAWAIFTAAATSTTRPCSERHG